MDGPPCNAYGASWLRAPRCDKEEQHGREIEQHRYDQDEIPDHILIAAWPGLGRLRFAALWQSRRLSQPLSLERFLHFRPGGNAIHIGLNVRPFRGVNVDPRRPTQ